MFKRMGCGNFQNYAYQLWAPLRPVDIDRDLDQSLIT